MFGGNNVAVAVKKRYRVDLAAELAECEANFARLQRLLPRLERDSHTFNVGTNLHLHIEVTERNPYTTTLEISQPPAEIPTVAPRLTVRIYHDARLAEVVAFTSRRRVQPRYDYPNAAMYQPDEKSQWNRFLGEWLSHCLQHGFAIDRPLSYCER
jgi:uncharacterized protein YqiB (DUF1249 family)